VKKKQRRPSFTLTKLPVNRSAKPSSKRDKRREKLRLSRLQRKLNKLQKLRHKQVIKKKRSLHPRRNSTRRSSLRIAKTGFNHKEMAVLTRILINSKELTESITIELNLTPKL
jgi:hypothetical protein